MPVSKTTPGRLGARVIAPIRVAFRQQNDVGTQDEGTFAAQWLAYALPCQRFAGALAEGHSRHEEEPHLRVGGPASSRSDRATSDDAKSYYAATWFFETLLKTMCTDLDLRELVT